MRKPDSCRGCPFWQTGEGFVPDEIIPGSQVLVLGQNPGEYEEKGRKITGYNTIGAPHWEPHPPAPYLGKTGFDMERNYFPRAGLVRGKVDIGNVVRCRVNNTNQLPPLVSKDVRHAIAHCQRAHGKVQESIRLIVAEGEYALYATTGEDGSDSPGHGISRGISGWRGWLLPYNPPPRSRVAFTDIYTPGRSDLSVLATYHLAFLYRSPWYRPASQRDWSRVPHVLQGLWPQPLPEIHSLPPEVWPLKAAFDTEFVPELDNRLTRYSLYDGKTLYVVEYSDSLVLPAVKGRPTVIMHNAEADIPHLAPIVGLEDYDIEDTMYAHSVLWADLDHDLDFLGSMYARTNRWKHLFETNPRVYSGGDAVGTWDPWRQMDREFERDPRSLRVYREFQMPLLPVIAKARAHGIRTHQGRVKLAVEDMAVQLDEATAEAQASVGWPISVGSPAQVKKQLYEVEKIDINPLTGRPRR